MTERCPCDCKNLPDFSLDEAQAAIHAINPAMVSGIDELDLPQAVLAGMNIEKEHCDLTGGDSTMTARIAIAHLREDPDYYQKLKQAGL